MSTSLFSGSSKVSTRPAGSAANASFVGANTVNGPSPCSVSTRPAACTAATSVEKSGLPLATVTMSSAAGGRRSSSDRWQRWSAAGGVGSGVVVVAAGGEQQSCGRGGGNEQVRFFMGGSSVVFTSPPAEPSGTGLGATRTRMGDLVTINCRARPRRRTRRPRRRRPRAGGAPPTHPSPRRRPPARPRAPGRRSTRRRRPAPGTSVIAFSRAASAVAVSASDVALAGDAEQTHRVHEATRPGADARQPLVGRGRRGEHHGLDAGGVGRLAPRRRPPPAAGRARSRRRCRRAPADAAKRSWPAWCTVL